VVVVVGAGLEAGRRAGCGHAPRHAQVGEQSERAVDGLVGHTGEAGLHQLVDLLGRQVAAVVAQRAVDQQALGGHPQPVRAEQLAEVRHASEASLILGDSK
jgi:hypothetical protein